MYLYLAHKNPLPTNNGCRRFWHGTGHNSTFAAPKQLIRNPAYRWGRLEFSRRHKPCCFQRDYFSFSPMSAFLTGIVAMEDIWELLYSPENENQAVSRPPLSSASLVSLGTHGDPWEPSHRELVHENCEKGCRRNFAKFHHILNRLKAALCDAFDRKFVTRFVS